METQLPPPPKGAQQLPLFGPCVLWPNGRISATAEHLYFNNFTNVSLIM